MNHPLQGCDGSFSLFVELEYYKNRFGKGRDAHEISYMDKYIF
jgi:hypothetical protein